MMDIKRAKIVLVGLGVLLGMYFVLGAVVWAAWFGCSPINGCQLVESTVSVCPLTAVLLRHATRNKISQLLCWKKIDGFRVPASAQTGAGQSIRFIMGKSATFSVDIRNVTHYGFG